MTPKKKTYVKNKVVVDFELYKKKCDYRWIPQPKALPDLEICAYYGRDKGTYCNSTLCPFVEWILDSIEIQEPYKKLSYIS